MMRNRSFIKDLYAFIPIVLSGLLCIALVFLLWQKVLFVEEFKQTISDLSSLFIGISGVLATLIMIYLASSAIGLKSKRHGVIEGLSKITQKMHYFRNIIEILLNSKMWLPGLKDYIDDEFDGLTFFDVKEFYKGRSKLAIEFLQENHHYGDTENLYLELKSLLFTKSKDKRVPKNVVYPKIYNRDIIEKWLEHKSGSGLLYYFGYKYGIYKETLDINAVYERHQDKIMSLANSIDSEVFEDSSFNEVFLSKLGDYFISDLLPKLYNLQDEIDNRLPRLLRYLYVIFMILVIFGVLLPILYLLFSLSIFTIVISFSIVISIIFFIAISFYQFMSNEIND
jgi:hypothetical protein